MKKCPFCAESIQDEAVKCRYCGEFIDPSLGPAGAPKAAPYVKLPVVIFSMVCVGPFAPALLPLVWKHPKLTKSTKITVSVLTVVFAVVLTVALFWAIASIAKYYKQIFSSLGAN